MYKKSRCTCKVVVLLIANLSKDVFERRTLTGSGAFFLFICLDAIKFSLQTFFSLLKTIYPRVSTKPLLNDAKSSLPVDVRRSKTLLLKLPNINRLLSCHSRFRRRRRRRCLSLQKFCYHGNMTLCFSPLTIFAPFSRSRTFLRRGRGG